MEILLPRMLCLSNIEETLKVCQEVRTNQNVVLDGQNYHYGSPLGLAMLKASLHSDHECRCKNIVWMPANKVSYLERIDFFEGVSCPGVQLTNNARKDQSARLFEITPMNNDLEAEDIATKVASTMSKSIEAEVKSKVLVQDFDIEKVTKPLRYLISELLLNATTHAKRHGRYKSKAWVAAQKSSECNLEIAIVDDGCGILRTLLDQFEEDERTHENALMKAMLPLTSCNLDVDEYGEETSNQGVGLFVAKDMLQRAGGSLQIITGNALYDSTLSYLPKRAQQFRRLQHHWDGVAVAITVPCTKIYGVKPADSLEKIPQQKTLVEITYD